GAVLHRVEAGSAVGRREALREEAGRIRPALARARPEDAVVLLDALIGRPTVVRFTARARAPELLERRLRTLTHERPAAEPARDELHHFEIALHAVRRGAGGSAPDDASLEVRERSFLLGPLRDGQYDVRQLRRLGEERIGHDQQIQPAQALFQ